MWAKGECRKFIGLEISYYLVHRRVQTIQLGEDLICGFGPGEGLGIIVVLGDVAVDGGLKIDDRVEAAASDALAGQRREEGLDGVQPGAGFGREVEGPARVTLEPRLDLGMVVGAVVVDDRMDHLAGRHGALDGGEEAQELLVAVALHATADHRAVERIEGSEQRGRAVANIVVRDGAGLARLERQAGLGPVQRLDLGFLVDREDQSMLGRSDIQADHVLELGGEVGIGRALEGAQAMGLQLVSLPDALHRAQRHAHRLGHGAAGPMRGFARRLAAGQCDQLLDDGGGQRRLARFAGLVPQQAVDPGLGEPPLPAPHGRPADPGPPCDLGDAHALGRDEHDPSPDQVLLRLVAIGDDRFQANMILCRDDGTYLMGHPRMIAHPIGLVNLLFVSVH